MAAEEAMSAATVVATGVAIVVMTAATIEQAVALLIAARGGLAAGGLAAIALVAMEQAPHGMAHAMAPALAPARVGIATRRRGDNGRGHGRRRRSGLLLSPLADQHGPCHQQERSIHRIPP